MNPAASPARPFVSVALGVFFVGLIGCQGAQDAADRPAQDKLTEAQQDLNQEQFAQAQAASDDAAAMPGLSPQLAASIHWFQGRLRVAAAQKFLEQAQAADLNVFRILGEVRLATMQAAAAQSQLKADQGLDPAPAIAKLRDEIAQAQGADGNGQWSPPAAPAASSESAAAAEPAGSQPVASPAPAPQTPAPQTPAPGGGSGIGGFFSSLLGVGRSNSAAAPAQPQAPAAPTAPAAPPRPITPDQILVLRSLSGLESDISRLVAQTAQNQQQAQSVASQRTAMLEQADQLQQKSLSETGQASVDDVTAAAESRRKAADLAAQLDQLAAAAVPLAVDLRKAQDQRVGVNNAIDDFNKQIADLQLAWTSVQQDMDAQKQATAALAGPSPAAAVQQPPPAQEGTVPLPPSPTTIADQCAQLKGLIGGVRDLRDQAANELKEAIKDFNGAAMASDEFRSDLSQSLTSDRLCPREKLALGQLQETFSGPAARLAAADAERTLALDYSADTMTAAQLKQILEAAQAALASDAPAAIADCLAATASPSVDDYSQLAEERFKDALDHFDGLTIATSNGPAAQARKTAAESGKMIAAFGAKQLSLALAGKAIAGQTPTDLQGVIDALATTISQEDPSMLPAIPYTIAAAPAQ